MKAINKYEMNDNITKDKLLEVGFTDDNPGYLYYCKNIYNEITLNIFVPENKNIETFTEFYALLGNTSAKPYSVLEKIVDSYNKEMGLLVEKGIFNQIKEEKKNKKRVRK